MVGGRAPPFPYLWLDATYEKVREGGRIVSLATVIAIGVRHSGEKCVLGVAGGHTGRGG